MRGALFAGTNLIGDTLATTPAVRDWKRTHPKDPVWYATYKHAPSMVLLKNPFIDRVKLDEDRDRVDSMRGYGNFTKKHLFDVQKAFAYGCRAGMHMSEAYGAMAGISITSRRPVLRLTDSERAEVGPIIPLSPYIVVCPHSVSSTVETKNRGGNKLWGDDKWTKLFPILSEMGYLIVSLGGPKDPKFYPDDDSAVFEFHDLPVRLAAAVMEKAAYVVTIDSGMAHIAAALDKNVVEIYPATLPLPWVFPHTTHNRVVQGYPPQVTVKTVAGLLEELIGECEGKTPGDNPEAAEPSPAALNDGEGFEDRNDGAPKGPRNNEEDEDDQ